MEKFDETFAALSEVLARHTGDMVRKKDRPGDLYIERPGDNPKAKPTFFGAVQTKKSYVSYHLMPIYEKPELLEGVDESLTRRMQGKSCFNFKDLPDQETLDELDRLTARAAAG